MNSKIAPPILVVGGTGTQGGSVARELLSHGHRVRVLSRNPGSPAAQQLVQQGAEIVQGDLADLPSLTPAMEGVKAIFSAHYADPYDSSIELRNAFNMVQAAKNAGVQQVIHTSAAGTNIFPRWEKSKSLSRYMETKYTIEEYIRNGGFQYWTILHPCWFMENFAEPLTVIMAPELKQGNLFGVLRPDVPIMLNCGEDAARLARAGFENPGPFHAKDINVAGDELTMVQIADKLSQAFGKKVTYKVVTHKEAVSRGLLEGTLDWQEWMNEVRGYGFDINETKAYGIPLKSFENWIAENKNRIVIN